MSLFNSANLGCYTGDEIKAEANLDCAYPRASIVRIAMAASKFVEFNQGVDDYLIYSERLEQFFTANNIKDDVSKVANLLSVIGVQPYKLLRNLCFPDLPKDKKYDDLSAMLKKHFCPQVNVWRERKKFYDARQGDDESIGDWYAKVCSLAINCDFGAKLTDVLKDKFATGIKKGTIFDRICEESEKATLEKLKSVAVQRENYEANGSIGVENVHFLQRRGRNLPTRQRSRQQGSLHYRQDNDSQRQQQPRRRSNQRQGDGARHVNISGNCKICGVSHRGSCRYKGYTCKKCGVKGHLSKVCQKNHVNFIDEDINGYVTNTFLNEEASNSNEPVSLFSISDNFSKKNQFLIQLEIDNKKFEFTLDSGSSVNCISSAIFKKYFKDYELKKDDIILRSYNGSMFTPLGYFVVNVKYLNVNKPLQIYVISDGGPCIVGRNFVEKFNLRFQMVHNINDARVTSDVKTLVKKYPEVFSNELGTFKYAKISLSLKNNAKPVFLKPRPIPLAYRKEMDEQLDTMVRNGILTPTETSEWATPLVPIIKSDGKLRLCGDYKSTVNSQLKEEFYSLPRIEEMFSKLHNGQRFTKLDLCQAYNQFLLDDEAKKLLVWSTHKGLFTMNRMPFGITPASGKFQRYLEQLFMGIDNVIIYLDDILVTGSNHQNHIDTLEKVLVKLKEA